MTWGELKKKLKKSGNKFHHQGGVHETWVNPKTGILYSVGRHNTQEVPVGTLNTILKNAGLK